MATGMFAEVGKLGSCERVVRIMQVYGINDVILCVDEEPRSESEVSDAGSRGQIGARNGGAAGHGIEVVCIG